MSETTGQTSGHKTTWKTIQDEARGGDVIRELTEEVKACNAHLGWNDNRTFGDEMALLHSEVSEALEEYRSHGFERYVTDEEGIRWIVGAPDDANGDPTGLQTYPDKMKPEGVASEFADIFIRLVDGCDRHGIDLYEEVQKKIAYNWTRSYRHGGKAL